MGTLTLAIKMSDVFMQCSKTSILMQKSMVNKISNFKTEAEGMTFLQKAVNVEESELIVRKPAVNVL